ncbi:MAG TPA: AI-2E family transporter [Aggregatilinea sp.]|jgi:predicted PurR-regulated permease PerM|uniref:AI-2E family transporter n=1 Tax=Aggregatilinea sp. TaxID=2806333 RepID=UPI002C8CE120|nr:AI-2E family transporter [Aggregatilinea sp.]HML22664.1 AI-2E family transporter [Aggregatilinea sp.]
MVSPELNPTGQYAMKLFIAMLMVVLALAAWTLRDALLLIFLAVIIALALQMPVQRLQRLGLSRGLSVLASFGGLIALIVILLLLVVPVLVEQVSSIVEQLPDAYDQARDQYDEQVQKHDWLPEINWDQLTGDDLRNFVMDQSKQLPQRVFPFFSGVGAIITSLIVLVFISLFIVTGPTDYLEGALTLVPRGYRARALEVFILLGQGLQRWFVGQLISMSILAVMIAAGTGLILGLENPLALGVFAGVMEFIPNFGSVIGVIPGVLIALAEDPALVPWVILVYLGTQQIQSNLIGPRLMSRQVDLPAAIVLISQVIASALFGFMGLLLAVPLAVVIMILIKEVYVTDMLNSRNARLETHFRPDGGEYFVVTTTAFRPEKLSPGEAARLMAQGRDPFEAAEGQIVEIITPPSPTAERAARGQQMVWVALLGLVVAQGLALLRSLISREAA